MPVVTKKEIGALTSKVLIVGEGYADMMFLHALIKARGLPDFDVRHLGQWSSGPEGGGVSHISNFLEAVVIADGFPGLTDLVLVVDSDESPQAALEFATEQVQLANPDATPPIEFIAPEASNIPLADETPLSTTGAPRVHILMLPWSDEKGSTDTLCLPAAREAEPLAMGCVDTFAQCTGADKWTVSKTSKMKLQSLLSSRFKRNPGIGLGRVWTEHAEALIPLQHQCFDKVGAYLSSFA